MSLLCRNDKPSGTFFAVNSNPKAERDAFKCPCLLLTGSNLHVLLVILIEHKRISSKWLEPRPWNLASDFPLSLAFNVERSWLENRVRIFRLKKQSSSLSFSKGIIFYVTEYKWYPISGPKCHLCNIMRCHLQIRAMPMTLGWFLDKLTSRL